MAGRETRLDETSVPPVSSLRSKFENLGAQLHHGRLAPPKALPASSIQNGTPPAVHRKPPLRDTSLRPVSMIEQPSLAQSSLSGLDDWVQSRSSFGDRSGHEVFGNGLLGSSSVSRNVQETEIGQTRSYQALNVGGLKDDTRPRTAAPPAKPQVPLKKPTLAAKFGEKVWHVAANDHTTASSTSHAKSSDEHDPAPGIAGDRFISRQRVGSDASWVERVRADSDASSHYEAADIFRDGSRSPEKSFMKGRRSPKKMTRSARVQSNASWVETLIPDSPVSPAEHRPQHYLVREVKELDDSERMPRLPPRPIVENTTVDLSAESVASSIEPPALGRAATRKEPGSSMTVPAPKVVASYETEAPRKVSQTTALSQGFARSRNMPSTTPSAASSTVSLMAPPTIPAPRRSLDRRKDTVPDLPSVVPRAVPQPVELAASLAKTDSDVSLSERYHETASLPFPDISAYNRRPPTWRQRPSQIPTEYDTRLLAVSGDYACTSGFVTRVWNVRSGEKLLNVIHPETFKVTAIAFKSAPDPSTGDGQIWLGASTGELHELDIHSQRIVDTSQRAHKHREVVRVYANTTRLWTLDASGNLVVWRTSKNGSLSLQSQFQVFHTQEGHNASTICGEQLWIATGKDIRIYKPTASTEADFQVGHISMVQMNIGEITSVATVETQPELLYFGHTDGKISICDRRSMRCISTIHVSLNKIGNLLGVGQHLWVGYGAGVTQVYDTSAVPWKTLKEWPAHAKQISSISCDLSSLSAAEGFRVVTLGADNILKFWDGLLEDDWIERQLHQADPSFCAFSEITASVLTWNAGAAKPSHLQHRIEDDSFLREYIGDNAHTDMLVFGFQELVDLEDKKLTAKSFFKSKKKDAFEQEHMTHQYRAWQDCLTTRVREYGGEEYTNLHTASMIGLFTCVFVKASIRHRIKHVHQAEVKRGMGGHYGNKGALVLRMVLDDSSICFVNCHLAAGQTQTSSRNADVAAILEAECLPAWPLDRNSSVEHADVFVSGGDGSVVLDHELCVLNGDLNYRVDTMSRDTVVKHVQQGNLTRLLDRDQLLLSRKKNPGFKLRALQERQIQFDPTYKYNVNSNEYDTSEKRRSPAWCDRILFRGAGKIKCDQYRRWEVRRIDPDQQAQTMQRCIKDFRAYKREIMNIVQVGAS